MCPSQIRRICLALAVAVLPCGPATAHERPTTTPAARFLQGTIDAALDLVRPPVTPAAGTALDILIGDSMDWQGLTQFAIGQYRTELDESGMGGVRSRLERQLGILARRAGTQLPALVLAIHDMRIDPDGSRHVFSTATLPRFGDIEVEWTLAPAAAEDSSATGGHGERYRIVDIAALGLTLRQFLRGWVAGLVAAAGGDAVATFEAPARAASGATSPQ